MEQFFAQWVYGRGVPRLAVDYEWNAASKKVVLKIEQTQTITADTPPFDIPLTVYMGWEGGELRRTVRIDRARQEFTIDVPSEPVMVCANPDLELLAVVDLKVPRAMRLAAAAAGPTVSARLDAVQSASEDEHADAMAALTALLRDDRQFHAVRSAACDAVARRQSAEALEALVQSAPAAEGDARVLESVLSGLSRYSISSEAHELLLRHAARGRPVRVRRTALSGLRRMRANAAASDSCWEVLAAGLEEQEVDSVRSVALVSIASLEDDRSFDRVLHFTRPGGDPLRTQALRSLPVACRNDDHRRTALDTLLAALADPDREVQRAAIDGLGALGDPKAIAELQNLATSLRSLEQRRAASRAMDRIRQPDDASRAIESLEARLAELESENRQLKSEFRSLKEGKEKPPAMP